MTRRVVLFVLGLGIAVFVAAAGAEQPKIVPVVGILFVSAGPDDPVVEALRAGLRDRGYEEGRDIRIVHRSAEGKLDRLLKGAKVSDLPVEQTERVRLVVNLKTAKTFGLEIPQSILLRADEVIK
jgi:ABC-type uncharacterized transport system substrate-binding protein